jgi:branched-subunit amino acid aminotransferase/4-amino-4-deoxychorismate lyase
MAESTIFEFTGSDLTPLTQTETRGGRVTVADSWRVVEGHAVGLDHHLERFRQSVERVAPEALSSLDGFIDAALTHLPPTGEWFPKLECVALSDSYVFRFHHRVAPERLARAVLATSSHDPRTSPLVKGPDLDALMALRREVASRGATEAVILTPEGFIAEGAYSSIVVWPPGFKEIWIVDESVPRIPGITEEMITSIARSRNIPVMGRTMRPDELDNHAVWVVSALHGIREATSWVAGPQLAPSSDLAQAWNRLLRETSAPRTAEQ